MPLRVVLGSLCLVTLATLAPSAHAEPAVATSPSVEAGPSLEAQVSAGSHATERGLARATAATDSGFGVAVDGSLIDSDQFVTSAREAGAHAQDATGPRDLDAYVRAGDEHRELDFAGGSSATSLVRYGARWRHSGDQAIANVELAGERDRIDDQWSGEDRATRLARTGGVASVRLPRLDAFGLEHDLAIGAGIMFASGEADGASRMNPASAQVRGNHRYIDAYIEDTIRVIRRFDINAGAVIERWSNLGSDVALGLDSPMDGEIPDVSMLLVSPTFGVVEPIDESVSLHASVYRHMRAPTLEELYRDGRGGAAGITGIPIRANPHLLPESVWTREVGPQIDRGTVSVRAAAFYSTIDGAIGVVDGQRANAGSASITGAYADASWQATPRWLATLGYTVSRPSEVLEVARYPHQLGSATLSYAPARSARLLAAVHVIDGASTIVDATAARELRGGLSAFVAVENLLDQRYLVVNSAVDSLGAPRIIEVGLRYFATGRP